MMQSTPAAMAIVLILVVKTTTNGLVIKSCFSYVRKASFGTVST